MRKFDFNFTVKVIDNLNAAGVLKTASLGMHEDWTNTSEIVWSNGGYVTELGDDVTIAGLVGSSWATPVLSVKLKDGSTKTFLCFHKEEDIY